VAHETSFGTAKKWHVPKSGLDTVDGARGARKMDRREKKGSGKDLERFNGKRVKGGKK